MAWYIAALRRYAVFNGRANRPEYWMFYLFNVLVALNFALIERAGILVTVYGLAVIVPTIAVSVRRLHDTGRSGWWLLIGLIPVIGVIVLFVCFLQGSHARENQYGSPATSLDRRSVNEAVRVRGDVIALAVLVGAALTASLVYFGSWSSAISGDEVGRVPGAVWLRAHVLLYLTGNALLLTTMGLSFAFGLSGTSTRGPWLEGSLLLVCLLFIAGVYCGSRFANPAWGIVPWSSDPKLILAGVTVSLLTLVALPVGIWMRVRMAPRERQLTFAWVLLLLCTVSAVNFVSPLGRTLHPNGTILAP